MDDDDDFEFSSFCRLELVLLVVSLEMVVSLEVVVCCGDVEEVEEGLFTSDVVAVGSCGIMYGLTNIIPCRLAAAAAIASC